MSILNTPHSIKTDIMGILNFVEGTVNRFFKGLEKNSSAALMKEVEKNELPPAAVARMKEIDDLRKKLRQLLDLA